MSSSPCPVCGAPEGGLHSTLCQAARAQGKGNLRLQETPQTIEPDWKRNITKQNQCVLLWTEAECGQYHGMVADQQTAELFLGCVRTHGEVPAEWLKGWELRGFRPKESVKVYYCAIAPLTDPMRQTWCSISQTPFV